MLLWESLSARVEPAPAQRKEKEEVKRAMRSPRLPYDHRCAALTKSGQRCRGKIREGSDFCLFHDPRTAKAVRQRSLTKAAKARRRLLSLPGGYLRKLTSRTAIGQAMDRLYREVRSGEITPEMGNVLFGILTRLMDTGLCDRPGEGLTGRSRADRLRPKVKELLTQAEKIAWRRAVRKAPDEFLLKHPELREQPGASPPPLAKPREAPVRTTG